MSADILVFYAGMLHSEHTHDSYPKARITWPFHIYNKAYVCVVRQDRYKHYGPELGWYAADGTPFTEDWVPKPLLLLKLLYS